LASYHIWHPAYVTAEPLTLEAFITLGDSLFLSRGTAALVDDTLEALSIRATPATWQFDVMRTHYFSSYRESSDDWRAAWDLVWRLRVTIQSESAPELPEPPGWGYFDLEAVDASYRPDDTPEHYDGWPCLLLADARKQSTIEAAQGIVERAYPHADSVRGQAFVRHPQLRSEIGFFPRAYYEQGATDAEATLKALVDAGAFVRFHDLEPAQDRD
jgi:hypothetical protein